VSDFFSLFEDYFVKSLNFEQWVVSVFEFGEVGGFEFFLTWVILNSLCRCWIRRLVLILRYCGIAMNRLLCIALEDTLLLA
jgi:hypothetical protein